MTATRPGRDWLVTLGLAVVTIVAAIGSFGALRGTALLAGWSRDMSPLLPITVDATAVVASRVWLSPDTPTDKARRFARSVAFGAIAVSLLGNGIFHMAEAGYLHPGVWLVIGAGGTSPLALAVVAHLAVLRGVAVESADGSESVADTDIAPDAATASETLSDVAGHGQEASDVVSAIPDMTVAKRPVMTRTPVRTDTAAKVAKLVSRHPNMSAREIAVKVGVSDRTVRRHLAALPATG